VHIVPLRTALIPLSHTVELPVDIHAMDATYETQFGTVMRPTHRNTSWDQAKFEVCAHRFADLSEFGYGVAVINDCKYGYGIEGQTIRLSLLRSPTAPDAEQDQGLHQFSFAIVPHVGTFAQSYVSFPSSPLNLASAPSDSQIRLTAPPPPPSDLPAIGQAFNSPLQSASVCPVVRGTGGVLTHTGPSASNSPLPDPRRSEARAERARCERLQLCDCRRGRVQCPGRDRQTG